MSNVNEELIQKYKNDNVIIKTFYTDSKGINIDGVVNPLKIDNRHKVSPTDNQERYPACAGFSACTLIESLLWRQTGRLIQLDSKQVYAKAKEIDNHRDMEGTTLEHSLKAALQLCDFDFLKNAKVETVANGRDLGTLEKVKFLIHKYDIIQAGFMIDEGWLTCTNSNYFIPKGGKKLGGHAVLITGYNQVGFFINNQWGTKWGSKGFAILPYQTFLEEFIYGAYLTGITY